MAYFSNSTDGSLFDYQCSLCKYGEGSCPIFLVQFIYNYDACNNPIARRILDDLVQNDGTCIMYKEYEKDFSLKVVEKEAPSLFDVCFGNID